MPPTISLNQWTPESNLATTIKRTKTVIPIVAHRRTFGFLIRAFNCIILLLVFLCDGEHLIPGEKDINGYGEKICNGLQGLDVGIAPPRLPLGNRSSGHIEALRQLFLGQALLLSQLLHFFIEFHGHQNYSSSSSSHSGSSIQTYISVP